MNSLFSLPKRGPVDLSVLLTGVLMATVAALVLAGCAGRADVPLDAAGTAVPPVQGQGRTAGIATYLRGTVAELDDRPELAATEYLGSLAEDPENMRLRLRSMNLALLGNDVATAVRLAKTLPAELASQTLPQMLLVMDNIRSGRPDLAEPALTRLAQRNPEVVQFQALYQQARMAPQNPQRIPVDQAVQALRGLKVSKVLEGRREYQIGRLWRRAGRTPEAVAALQDANAREPGALFTTRLLGEFYEQAGQRAQAADLYGQFAAGSASSGLLAGEAARVQRGERAVPLPDSARNDAAQALMDFSLLLWGQGVAGPARQLVNIALWVDGEPRDPWLQYYAGIVEEFSGDKALAAQRYDVASRTEGLQLATRLRLIALQARGNGENRDASRAQAQQAVEELARVYPDEPAVWSAAADLAVAQEDYARALTAYNRLEQLLPPDAAPAKRAALLYSKGATLERLRRYDEAEVALKGSLTLAPNEPQTLNYLGYMWVEQGKNLLEAEAMLLRALALAPNDGAIVDSVGWAYFTQGNLAKARVYLERAAELTPDDATVTDHLGDLYAKTGRVQEARRQWLLALEQLPPGEENALRRTIERKLQTLPTTATP